DQVTMASNTIGDLLEAAQITWGGFMGGFDLTITNPNGTTGCLRSLKSNITGVTNGTQPAVSFLKAQGYQDGHAGYSDPTDEQHFLVNTLNFLQQGPNW